MARKAAQPASNPEPVADPAPALSYELTPISLLQRTPRTRDEVALREEVRKQITALESAVVAFVAVK